MQMLDSLHGLKVSNYRPFKYSVIITCNIMHMVSMSLQSGTFPAGLMHKDSRVANSIVATPPQT